MALTPLSALAPSASRVLERLAPPPEAVNEPPPKARPWKLLILACFGLAALSLLLPSVPTYDPWAWIIWGREIANGDLVTSTGPSWKPLPVLFTTPFSFAGDDGAPLLWLLVARAGGILAFAMAFRLGMRLAGPWAGAIAAASLFLADEFIRNFFRGNSEGILVALCLWAVERHLDGRRRDAFWLGIGAALLRPEVWPFIALYGLYLLIVERRLSTVLIVGGGGLGLIVLWFLPEYLGSGDFLRAANRARQPNPDSAAFAAHPFIEVFNRSASVLSLPVYVGGCIAFVVALFRRDGLYLSMAAIGTVLMVAVAGMTQAGFAGNLRYLVPAEALFCVLAGVGAARVPRALAIALLVVLAAFSVGHIRRDLDSIAWRAQQRQHLDLALERAGGARALERCGNVQSGYYWRALVSSRLHADIAHLDLPRDPTRVLVRAPAEDGGEYEPERIEPGLTRRVALPDWEIWTACPRR